MSYTHHGMETRPKFTFYDIGYKIEIIIDENDILIFEKDNFGISPNGGTTIYFEQTADRIEFYKK